MPKIEFNSHLKGFITEPFPAVQSIPEAYKKMNKSFEHGDSPVPMGTVKSCIPFLDAMISGYVIPFGIERRVIFNNDEKTLQFFTRPEFPNQLYNDYFMVHTHKREQITENMKSDYRTFPDVCKFLNNWIIKTPPGYSCLITQPFNRNAPFKIVDGIVDTDSYDGNIHIPFYWTGDLNKEYILKHDDPMCFIFPFKRDNWKMEVSYKPYEGRHILKLLRYLADNYKKTFWKKKSYK